MTDARDAALRETAGSPQAAARAVTDRSDLMDALNDLHAAGAHGRGLFVLGFVGILAGFMLLAAYFYQQREGERRQGKIWHAESVTWQRKAVELEARLNAIRAAVAGERGPEAERLARIGIVEAQQLVEDTATPPLEVAPGPGPQPKSASPPIPSFAIPPAGAHQQIVYIQFAGSISRETIIGLNRSLRAAGWRAQGPSGERIASAGGLNEVRYSSEADRDAAEALAAALTGTSIGRRTVVARRVAIIRPGVLEVWISN
jgi:hypothetical protein